MWVVWEVVPSAKASYPNEEFSEIHRNCILKRSAKGKAQIWTQNSSPPDLIWSLIICHKDLFRLHISVGVKQTQYEITFTARSWYSLHLFLQCFLFWPIVMHRGPLSWVVWRGAAKLYYHENLFPANSTTGGSFSDQNVSFWHHFCKSLSTSDCEFSSWVGCKLGRLQIANVMQICSSSISTPVAAKTLRSDWNGIGGRQCQIKLSPLKYSDLKSQNFSINRANRPFDFYRTQVSLGSDLWVRFSETPTPLCKLT